MYYSITSGPHILAGKLKGLVVTGSKRIESLPGVPTVLEAGLPGAEVYGWGGFLVPAGTPANVVTQLNKAIHQVLQRTDIRSMLESEGAEVISGSPNEFQAYMASERGRFQRIVKRAGIETTVE